MFLALWLLLGCHEDWDRGLSYKELHLVRDTSRHRLKTHTLEYSGKCRSRRTHQMQRQRVGIGASSGNAEVIVIFALGSEGQELDYPSVRGSQLLDKGSAQAEARKHKIMCVFQPPKEACCHSNTQKSPFLPFEKCRWNQLMFENLTWISFSKVPKQFLSIKSIWQLLSCLRTQFDVKALPTSCYFSLSEIFLSSCHSAGRRHGQADHHHHFAQRSAAMATWGPYQSRGFWLGYSANN